MFEERNKVVICINRNGKGKKVVSTRKGEKKYNGKKDREMKAERKKKKSKGRKEIK